MITPLTLRTFLNRKNCLYDIDSVIINGYIIVKRKGDSLRPTTGLFEIKKGDVVMIKGAPDRYFATLYDFDDLNLPLLLPAVAIGLILGGPLSGTLSFASAFVFGYLYTPNYKKKKKITLTSKAVVRWFMAGTILMPISWGIAKELGWNFDPVALVQSGGQHKSYKDWSAAEKKAADTQKAIRQQDDQRKLSADRARREEEERKNASLRAEKEARDRAVEAVKKAESDQRWRDAEIAVEENNQIKAMKARLGNVDDTVLWAYLYCSKMESTNDIKKSVTYASLGAFGAWGIREYKLQVGGERAAQLCPQYTS